jgi:flagellar basal body-associated protein FliL
MEIDLENAITAKKALEISKRSIWLTIVVLLISTIGAGLAILDFFGDKKWQDNQISALRETNTLLKQQIELKLTEKTTETNQPTYGSSPWQEYIKSDIDIAINNLGE